MKRFFIIISLIFLNNFFYGQSVRIAAVLDTNIIGFADQTMLRIQIQPERNSMVLFPQFEDTIGDGIEIVEEYKVDTINQKPFTLEKSYLITSFVDSIRDIPQLPVIVDLDTFLTNKLKILIIPLNVDFLTILTVSAISAVDSSHLAIIYDIKKPLDAPLTFREFWLRYGKWILLALIILIIVAIVFWIIKRKMNNKPVKLLEKPQIPAHIIALKKLNKLKNKKIFHQDNTKEFYTELTLIIRAYIEQRFRIPALENTSTEILNNFDAMRIINSEQFEELKTILNMADLAKFAKYKPQQNTNESNFDLAHDFVDKTKIISKPTSNSINK